MSEAAGFNVYNIGTGRGTTVKELLAAYGNIIGRELPLKPSRTGRVMLQAPLPALRKPITLLIGQQD